MSLYGPQNDSNNKDPVYFAAKDAEKTASILMERGSSFFNMLRGNAYLDKINKMWRFYHGAFSNDLGYGHQVNFTGDQGELVMIPINHFRNIGQHILNLITSARPVMECRAVNTDYKSLSQAYLGNGILDYYMREKKLEDVLRKAVELSIVLGAGYVKMEWNATAGETYEVDPDTGEQINEGEVEFSNLSPLDVIFDGTKEGWDNDWLMVRGFQNRYNLMAKYPELADKIRALPSKSDSTVYRLAVWSNDDTDDIPIYEFYHKKTEAMPEGRYMLFADYDVVLMDTKMPYREIPIYRIVPSEILGTPYGYSPLFDIYPIQEGINSLYSTIMTNQNAFGVQNIFVKRGSDINFNSIEGAMNIIEANEKPEALNLTATPPEVFKFLEELIKASETISGINSVTRGNPEASLKSGTALALVQAQSLQFVSGLQQSYVKLIESAGTGLINILKDFATAPKVIALVGKNNRTFLKEFTGDQIKDVNRVIVDMGNPLSHSIAGRVQMAEQMLQMKLITDPNQYFQVINTGRLDSMFEGTMTELLLIKAENEKMLDGENPLVSPTDKHSEHITEHKSILADPDMRNQPELVKVVMDHLQDHLNALRNTDPDLLKLCGEVPLPPIMPPGAPPMGPGGPPQGAPPQGAPQGQPPQGSLKNSHMSGLMAAPQAPMQPGQKMAGGPGAENIANIPHLPKVPSSLLPNSALQESMVGNVNLKR